MRRLKFSYSTIPANHQERARCRDRQQEVCRIIFDYLESVRFPYSYETISSPP